jgi:hypothetical protein
MRRRRLIASLASVALIPLSALAVAACGGGAANLFTGDTAPGQTTGQGSAGFGAPWYVLAPGGDPITGSASANGSSSSAGY